MARVLTAWPASDELTRPYLGYVTRPMQVVRIEHFAAEQLMSAADARTNGGRADFEVALVFSTKDEPAHPLLEHWRLWQEWKARFFDYHRDAASRGRRPDPGRESWFTRKTRKGNGSP